MRSNPAPILKYGYLQLRMERQHFTRDELDHYKEAFSMYDTHDRGYITTKELGALIRLDNGCIT